MKSPKKGPHRTHINRALSPEFNYRQNSGLSSAMITKVSNLPSTMAALETALIVGSHWDTGMGFSIATLTNGPVVESVAVATTSASSKLSPASARSTVMAAIEVAKSMKNIQAT